MALISSGGQSSELSDKCWFRPVDPFRPPAFGLGSALLRSCKRRKSNGHPITEQRRSLLFARYVVKQGSDLIKRFQTQVPDIQPLGP